MTKRIHPSLTASATAGVVLLTLSTVTPLPWPIWATWGALTAVAVGQAVRA